MAPLESLEGTQTSIRLESTGFTRVTLSVKLSEVGLGLVAKLGLRALVIPGLLE